MTTNKWISLKEVAEEPEGFTRKVEPMNREKRKELSQRIANTPSPDISAVKDALRKKLGKDDPNYEIKKYARGLKDKSERERLNYLNDLRAKYDSGELKEDDEKKPVQKMIKWFNSKTGKVEDRPYVEKPKEKEPMSFEKDRIVPPKKVDEDEIKPLREPMMIDKYTGKLIPKIEPLNIIKGKKKDEKPENVWSAKEDPTDFSWKTGKTSPGKEPLSIVPKKEKEKEKDSGYHLTVMPDLEVPRQKKQKEDESFFGFGKKPIEKIKLGGKNPSAIKLDSPESEKIKIKPINAPSSDPFGVRGRIPIQSDDPELKMKELREKLMKNANIKINESTPPLPKHIIHRVESEYGKNNPKSYQTLWKIYDRIKHKKNMEETNILGGPDEPSAPYNNPNYHNPDIDEPHDTYSRTITPAHKQMDITVIPKEKKSDPIIMFPSSDAVRQLGKYEEKEMDEDAKWIQKAIKHPGRCAHPGSPECPEGSPQYKLAMRFKHGDIHKDNLNKENYEEESVDEMNENDEGTSKLIRKALNKAAGWSKQQTKRKEIGVFKNIPDIEKVDKGIKTIQDLEKSKRLNRPKNDIGNYEIEETSDSSGAGSYQTPFAFGKGNQKKSRAMKASAKSGYTSIREGVDDLLQPSEKLEMELRRFFEENDIENVELATSNKDSRNEEDSVIIHPRNQNQYDVLIRCDMGENYSFEIYRSDEYGKSEKLTEESNLSTDEIKQLILEFIQAVDGIGGEKEMGDEENIQETPLGYREKKHAQPPISPMNEQTELSTKWKSLKRILG